MVGSLLDAPILLFVSFHKAFHAELGEIYRYISSDSFDVSSTGHGEILDIRNRFEFLKLVYRYHCAAEDEIVFRALDVHVSNVACTYSLEHRGIDDLFDSVFQCLILLLDNDGNSSMHYQELVYTTATLQATISQHMLKEEEQVFPLLVQQFSFKEQASLVWQFFCSVPIILLENILPWMTSYLPKDEQADVLHCIKEVVPKEELLQGVLESWLGRQTSLIGLSSTQNKAAMSSDESFYLKKFQKIYSWASSDKKNCIQGELDSLHDIAKYHPVDTLHLWHASAQKDFKGVLEDLYEISNSEVFSNLASVGGQIKFLIDVLILYSDALENVFFSVLKGFSDCCLSFSHKQFLNGCHIEGLLGLLQSVNVHSGTSLSKLVEMLCQQLEALLEGICKHFVFQELEVLPLIRKHCSYEMQQKLLYMSLHMMPLGLLKYAITWFLSHLNEDELKILYRIRLAGSELDMSFPSLLHKWVSFTFSGKTSHEMFKKELLETFTNKSYYVPKNKTEERTGFIDLDLRRCKRILHRQEKPNSVGKATKGALGTSLQNNKEKDIRLYSSEISLQIHFPHSLEKLSPIFKNVTGEGNAGSSLNPEFKPIDYIFLFHKALTNDLNYLVHESTKIAENFALLEDFRQRFHLLRFLYEIHSDNEDKFAFPALEAKGKYQNISLSYTIDHKIEVEHFNQISAILDKISNLHVSLPSEKSVVVDATTGQRLLKYQRLCMKLHGKCKTMCVTLGHHFQREEVELWPLFIECFSDEEQNKIIGSLLGNTRAEVLQQMIPWLMASLSPTERSAMMSLWRKATQNTMFDEWLAEWLAEWWEGMSTHNISIVAEEPDILPLQSVDPLEIIATYLDKKDYHDLDGSELSSKRLTFQSQESFGADFEISGDSDGDDKMKNLLADVDTNQCSELTELQSDNHKQNIQKVVSVTEPVYRPGEHLSTSQKFKHLEERILGMSQEDLEAAIRRVHRDATLDLQKKSFITQSLLTSRWTVTQQKPHQEVILSSNDGEIPGQFPSYRDPLTFGCKHYKRNCKVLAACCMQLFTCRYCHDDTADHAMDRKSTIKMMCMKCLKVQPVGATCSTISCNGFSMAKFFCIICRLYDDERDIYHCPYCNLCRVGKGLGVDYFHCMNCNACMSMSLAAHICREKCFESNCPICHEYIFTSSSPVKCLPCGHLMHSTCFQDHTCMHYTCPICSKSLGDMQVYFRMLDALLAEEKSPEEYFGQTQVILCNDCEKRGVAPFHWLYHKCSNCGSYNTRLL
ncbi:hypothetical protein IFM89_000639 [Coptis chinensis]|uniref:Uncharacterized protein n=1 Tax=Coptis chinensis TaxID=261450 RepID=A0A835IFT6_9MAGN|nr:hypothetical protein IFM89_000639 [Coptis chinensis]